MSIRHTPFPSKYQVTPVEMGGPDMYWSTTTSYKDLLFANGQHVRDYVDLTRLVRGLDYKRFGINQSTALSPLVDFAMGAGVEIVDKNYVRWRIYGTPERRAMSLGNTNTQDYIGIGRLTFKYWSDVDWFKEHDVLSPVKNKRIQIVITSPEGIPLDGGYEYEAVLLTDDETEFIDADFFEGGEYWIKMGSLSSWEKMGSAGSIQFGDGFSYIEFEVPMTTMSWNFEVEGEADRQFGAVQVDRCDEAGRPMTGEGRIANYLLSRANAQIDEEKELFLAYGTSAKTMVDTNTGRPMTTGPGLFEFMEQGNIIPYSPESNGIDFIIEHLNAVWFDKVPIPQREALFYTGEAGTILFSNWVREKFNDTATITHYDFLLNQTSPFDQRSSRKGFRFANPQFTEYLLDGYGAIKVAHWPILDNTRINGVTYPGSIYPASSYEFIAFNIGFGSENIQFLSRQDNKISTFVPGLWTPFGAPGPDNPVYKFPVGEEESYKWIHRETFGMLIMDPTATVWFKPNVNY